MCYETFENKPRFVDRDEISTWLVLEYLKYIDLRTSCNLLNFVIDSTSITTAFK
jgi:hypothetical protein